MFAYDRQPCDRGSMDAVDIQHSRSVGQPRNFDRMRSNTGPFSVAMMVS